jgi:hypothetical protein
MENSTFNFFKRALYFVTACIVTISCQRDLSDDATLANFSKTGEVFTDNFVNMGSDFYLPFAGSKFDAFSLDTQEGYQSNASIRINVPNANNPTGNYAGAILRVDGAGRDLSGFDAVTFWAKASQGVRVDAFGFGQDFLENKFQVTINDISIETGWAKYIIPIPDPAKLLEERGVFWYAMGTQTTGGLGYTVWLDEIKFEKLGTVAQPRPVILNSQNAVQQAFTGSSIPLSGLTQTFNLASSGDVTVIAAPSYFDFTSSNPAVAMVSESGVVSVIGSGTAVITGSIAGTTATGSLALTSAGTLPAAPIPTEPQSLVKCIFSDTYILETTSNFSPGFGGSTTQTTVASANNDDVLIYANNNFTGIIFDNTVDASTLTFMHVDVYVQQPGAQVRIDVRDIGADGVISSDGNGFPTGDDREIRFNTPTLTSGVWTSFEIPLTGNILNQKNNLGAIILVGGPNFILDNIYFYGAPAAPTAPTTAAPNPTRLAANVMSLFSNAYADVPVDTWRTPWSAATLQDITIAGNATKLYTNLDFVGIETVVNPVNATAMTHIHADVWSPDFTSFSIKLVDFGSNGIFGGGDDTEHQVNFTAPARGSWIGYDIPLSNFSGLLNRANIAQYILVAQPTGSPKVYLDNMYFYN